uniref:Uncharacterized protein n=1 Tax=Romanomermis culicivorax TaxID=13658 RepID=A0A915L7J9_ROMCU
MISGSSQAIGNTLSGGSQGIEHVITATIQSLMDGLNNLQKGPLQILINLAVIIVVILFLPYLVTINKGKDISKTDWCKCQRISILIIHFLPSSRKQEISSSIPAAMAKFESGIGKLANHLAAI